MRALHSSCSSRSCETTPKLIPPDSIRRQIVSFPRLKGLSSIAMDFRANDPGCVQFGNFINYYQFNPAEDRVALLPNHVWLPPNAVTTLKTPYLVLDVGCNSGNITQLLLDYLSQRINRQVRILGVDLDPVLIKRAKETNNNPQQIELECVDVMNDDFSVIENYLRLRSAQKFDAVFCFSITMWIHLNHHDNGLREFLKKCSSVAELLVVEPQPWKCYQTALRRMKRSANESFPYFPELKWRANIEDEIHNYLEDGLHRKKVYETSPTKWKRKICFYR